MQPVAGEFCFPKASFEIYSLFQSAPYFVARQIKMDIRTLKWYLNAIISPFGIILNILLLFLIHYKSSKNLENYKKVLYLGCITDIIYGINMAFAQPVSLRYKMDKFRDKSNPYPRLNFGDGRDG